MNNLISNSFSITLISKDEKFKFLVGKFNEFNNFLLKTKD